MKAKKQTKLINYRTYSGDKSKIWPIDRGTIFGNPFIIGKHGNREDVIELYKQDFRIRIQTDPIFKARVLELVGQTLGCWCRPDEGFKGRLLCHGQIIIAYLEGCKPEEVE